ncbi:MAG: ABC transporter permease [Thermoplasmata archaeon]|jgi:ABC-type dipeptide/oligopeptide/nickel transport system permease component|nr:ABC transporter permease [Thermoplasmata archaeon]MCI4342307.1 ABC transporter permease [Thermoplasmata archaeon]
MRMWVYVIRRLLLMIPVIIGVMTITFVLVTALGPTQRIETFIGPSKQGYSPMINCIPGDTSPHPAQCPNPAYVRAVHALGLDKPVEYQWGVYIYNSLTLNWGNTSKASDASQLYGITTSTAVITVLSWYLPYTLELAAISLVIILALAIPIGNYSAVYRNRPFDQAARVVSFSGYAFPGFLLALLLLLAATQLSGGFVAICHGGSDAFNEWFGSWPSQNCLPGGNYPNWMGSQNHFHTSPTGFPTVDAILNGNSYLAWESFKRMILPALTIAFGAIAGILRFVRNSMLEVMNLDFIRTARAKGVPERTVVRRHAGRNSLNVTVTILGLTFAGFIGGFPVTEQVFGLTGIGNLLVQSVHVPIDYGLVFGTTLLFTIIVVIANIIVDVLYAFLDPRVRLG